MTISSKIHWFHDWTKWEFIVTKEGRPVQTRECKICGKKKIHWMNTH